MTLAVIAFIMIAWFALLIYLGHRYPVVAIPGRAYLTNSLAAVVIFAVGMPLAYVTGAAAVWVTQTLGLQLSALRIDQIGIGIPGVDGTLRVVAMIFVPLALYDLWLAMSHRLEHYVPVLWDFHRVHHSDRWINPLTVFRDSFVQVVWRAFFPILTVGIFVDLDFKQGGQAALYSQLFLYAWSALCHSNIRLALPWLDGILVTPQYHRIHHSVLPEHADKNFADIFPVFDMLLGSYVRPKSGEFPATGLSSGERIDGIGRVVVAPFQAWFGRARSVFGARPRP